MENIQEKAISGLTEVLNSKIHIPGIKKNSYMQETMMDYAECDSKQKYMNREKNQQKRVQAVSHTEAEVNWAEIASKITTGKAVKIGMTVSGVPVGSFLGSVLGAAVGHVAGGKGSAAIGIYLGNFVGVGAGIVGGYKFGKYVADQIDSSEQNDFIKKGDTQICVETITESSVKKEVDKDEISS